MGSLTGACGLSADAASRHGEVGLINSPGYAMRGICGMAQLGLDRDANGAGAVGRDGQFLAVPVKEEPMICATRQRR
jgi:hypothetical protein